MLDATGPDVTVGPSILGLVTSGIYDDPLSIYREYIQNSVDELSRRDGVEGRVDITIDPRRKRVSICDNGHGLTYQECLENLVPIAQSKKRLGQERGFRGIGRLSGLAFAESVTFLTRTSAIDPVTRVLWTRNGITKRANPSETAEHDFENLVNVETLEGLDYPDHFFQVEIDGVSRHSAGVLLNREAVRGYISEVCPVPLAPDFPFFKDVQGVFQGQEQPYSLQVFIDDAGQPILKQYSSAIVLSGSREDHFHEFERVRVPSIDGDGDAAVGWIAHSSYLGAIPKANRIRGIRARIGNIQVGDERTFDHLFEEERFNRWCVGEVHILDSRIVPNGRRDYFELNPHLRNLENHLAPIFRQISARCRAESSNRNKEKRMVSTIADIEAVYELAASGCLTLDDTKGIVDRGLMEAEKIYQELKLAGIEGEASSRLNYAQEKLSEFQHDGKSFPVAGLVPSEVDLYRRVCGAIAASAPSARAASETISVILKEAGR